MIKNNLLFCDWYTATISDDILEALQLINDTFEVHNVGKGFRGYTNSSRVHYRSQGVQRYWTLAQNDDHSRMKPSIDGSSYSGADLRGFLVGSEIPHETTRIDIATDFRGCFDSIADEVVEFGKANGLGLDRVGDWVYGENGRTQYIGSFKSATYGRLYEKGKELQSKGFKRAEDDYLRLEICLRPKKMKNGQKIAQFVASASLEDALSTSKWATELFNMLFGMKLAPIRNEYLKNTDLDLALEHMIAQYGKLLRQKSYELGGLDMIGEWLIDQLGRN